VSRPVTDKVVKPQNAVALSLFFVILVIVIAPSVDLEPTVLRSTHQYKLGLLLVAVSALVLKALRLETFYSVFSPIDNGAVASREITVRTCSLRC
jgi:hypothetical protein